MKRRRQFEKFNDGRCPWYGKLNEDFDHIVRCPHNYQEGIEIWTKLMAPLRGVSTCPYVIKTFDKGLQKWLATGTVRWEGKIPNRDDEIGQATFQAFLNQQAIGWNQAIRGRISRQWGIANPKYCKSRGLAEEVSRTEQWTTNLVNILWKYGLECWRLRNQYCMGTQ